MSEENTTVESTNTTDDLPQWARDRLTKANNEAAKYRTEKNEAVEKAKAEVTDSFTTKIEELESKLTSQSGETSMARNEVERLKAAINAGVKQEKITAFADLLKGDNEEELAAHAEELKDLFVEQPENSKQSAIDPSQGRGNQKHTPLNGDPLLQALTSKLGI